jgi:hypothetical protein
VLSLRGLPLPHTCVFVTTNEARSYFASTVGDAAIWHSCTTSLMKTRIFLQNLSLEDRLTPSSNVTVQKLRVAQLLKKFPASYGNRRQAYIIVFSPAHPEPLRIQYPFSHLISLRYILILSPNSFPLLLRSIHRHCKYEVARYSSWWKTGIPKLNNQLWYHSLSAVRDCLINIFIRAITLKWIL